MNDSTSQTGADPEPVPGGAQPDSNVTEGVTVPEEPTSRRAAHAGRRRRSRTGGFAAVVKEVVLIGVTALVISFLVKTFIAQAFWIPSGSMENTLVYGDRVMVSKIQAGPMSIERGDIIVFEDPGGWLPPSTPTERGPVLDTLMDGLRFVGIVPAAEGNHLIKRVIATGGDTVVCCDDQGRITVNDHPLEEDYLFSGDAPSNREFEVDVPQGHLWMMGDHRSNSRDSRDNDSGDGSLGAVPEENVVGQAFVLIFPLSNATWFSTPETFAQIPEARQE